MSLYRAIYIRSVMLLRTVCLSHKQLCFSFILATCTVYDDEADNYRERDVK